MRKNIFKDGVYMNREYSWMLFNDRVLDEADEKENPIFERAKFLSIFTSNLDEFYMVRMGSLDNQMALTPSAKENKTKLTAEEQTDGLLAQTKLRYKRRAEVWQRLKKELKEIGLKIARGDDLGEKQRKEAFDYFRARVAPYLSPIVIDVKHPMLRFFNKAGYIVYELEKDDKTMFGLLPVPERIQRIIELSSGKKKTLITIEDLIGLFGGSVFTGYTVKSSALVRVTRNADFETNESDVDSEYDSDFSKYLKDKVDARASLSIVRLEISDDSDKIKSFLLKNLGIKKNRCFTVGDYFDYKFLFSLHKYMDDKESAEYKYPPFKGKLPYAGEESLIECVKKKDIFLSYPFDGMETFIKLLDECADSDKVRSIKITIYRLSEHSKIAAALIRAAEKGKDVTVVIELLARFDEESNMNYAGLLSEAGCTVIYGMGNYKVHSKIVSVVLESDGKVEYITHIGTGNYNESTAKQYTDLNIITANEEIGKDATEFFRCLAIGSMSDDYVRLAVSPTGLKNKLSELIDEQIALAKDGKGGHIIAKMNSFTDKELMEKFIEASVAGVKCELIVRGICCLVPGIAGKTDNITVKSIVGRFLEHSRIYRFGDGKDAKVYISSADLMTRNIERRVEIAAPVLDADVRNEIDGMLSVMLADNVNGRCLTSDGKYVKAPLSEDTPFIDSQAYFLKPRK